jgi:hypothetical protein
LQSAHDAFGAIERRLDARRVRLVVGLFARADLADGQRAVHQPVSERTIDVEETNRLRRQQALVRHQVFERDADQQA